jgi:hypothetical protein
VHYHIDREQLRSIFLISSISLLKKVFTSMWAGSVLFSFLFARHDFTSYVNHKLEQRALLLLEKPTPQVPKEIHGENCFLGGKAPHRIFPFSSSPFFDWSWRLTHLRIIDLCFAKNKSACSE